MNWFKHWFKLVGATQHEVAPDWEHDEPALLTRVHFPRNKRPNLISNGERMILYAVGKKLLIATVTVTDTKPASKERTGPPGTDEHRWPWKVHAQTHYFCSPLDVAPKLADAAPEFLERYRKKFRDGSHWPIEDADASLTRMSSAGKRSVTAVASA